MITETFLTERRETKRIIKDFENDHDLEFFGKNRGSNIAGGGAAIVIDKRKGKFKEYSPVSTSFETVTVAGTMYGYGRKMVIVCSYMPPGGLAGHTTCKEEIIGILNQAKVDFGDPFLLLGRDFNEFGKDDILSAVPDLREAVSPPTRSLSKIDLVATNFNSAVQSSEALEPLSDLDGVCSDHNVMSFRATLPKKHLSKWITIKKRKFTPEAEQ